jgi:hypothetical protein
MLMDWYFGEGKGQLEGPDNETPWISPSKWELCTMGCIYMVTTGIPIGLEEEYTKVGRTPRDETIKGGEEKLPRHQKKKRQEQKGAQEESNLKRESEI